MSSNKPVALLIALGALLSCGTKPVEPVAKNTAAPLSVTAVSLKPTLWPETYEAVGTVRARSSAVISSRITAAIQTVSVQGGTRVAAGQLLATLDARDLESAVRQAQSNLAEARAALPESDSAISSAQAQLTLAQSTLRRMRELFDKRSLSAQELDEANARVQVAQAAHAMASARKTQLLSKISQTEQAVQQATVARGYAEIKAPFPALVVTRHAEPGALASPGVALFDLEQPGAYRLEVSVEEHQLSAIRTGQPVHVTLDALDSPLSGTVGEIVPAVDPASRAFLVKINLPPQANLRGGLFGRAQFSLGQRSVLAIPQAAILTQGQLQSVFVEEGGIAHARLITLGPSQAGSAEVLSGLRPGDRLIHPRPATLHDGDRIEVRP